MRPTQNNKRMRGRPNNNRKGPNPLTRSYELSGPDVKIRGTAHHISEKYLQLARDAQTSGDPVMAESYLQHAEHYFRLIAAAQLAQQQGPGVYPRQPGEVLAEEAEDESDFGGIPDRFASIPERFSPPPQPSLMAQPQPGSAQPSIDRPFQDNGDRQQGRQTRQRQTGERQTGFHPAGAWPASGAPFSGQELPGPRIPSLPGKALSGTAALSRSQWPRT